MPEPKPKPEQRPSNDSGQKGSNNLPNYTPPPPPPKKEK